MPRIRTRKARDLFPFEIDGEIYRQTGGAWIKKNDGSFIKVGSGKGKYSIKLIRIRKK